MTKDIKFSVGIHTNIIHSVDILAGTVRVTLSPKGRNVVLGELFGSPLITNDGVTIAKEVELKNHFENMETKFISEVTSKTNDIVGDGTTTATVLTQAIIRESLKDVIAGTDPIGIRRGIESAVAVTVDELKAIAQPVVSKEAIAQVATVSSRPEKIDEHVSEVMERVGNDGITAIEESRGMKTEPGIIEGMQFGHGCLSQYMVTDSEEMVTDLKNPHILITDKKISDIQDIPLPLEEVLKTSRPFLIITDDVGGETLPTLILNKIRGTFNVIAVKIPGLGDRHKAVLEDIAVLTGGTVITEGLGLDLEDVNITALGQAIEVTVDKDSTVIAEEAGKASAIVNRVDVIKSQFEAATSEFGREKLQGCLTKLADGVVVIKVGAATGIELKEIKLRIEDAPNATRAAVEEGIIASGGTALVSVISKVAELELDGGEATGRSIILRALGEPARQVTFNAGYEGSVVVEHLKNSEIGTGFNAASGEWVNTVKAGIIDPVKVTRSALQNAASVISLTLMTEAVVANHPGLATPAPAVPGIDPSMMSGL